MNAYRRHMWVSGETGLERLIHQLNTSTSGSFCSRSGWDNAYCKLPKIGSAPCFIYLTAYSKEHGVGREDDSEGCRRNHGVFVEGLWKMTTDPTIANNRCRKSNLGPRGYGAGKCIIQAISYAKEKPWNSTCKWQH